MDTVIVSVVAVALVAAIIVGTIKANKALGEALEAIRELDN